MEPRGTDWGAACLQALREHSLDRQASLEIEALAQEKDPELLLAGLVDFANRELNRERPASAVTAYQAVAENSSDFPELAAKARQRLGAIEGHGQTGVRVEYLLRDLAKHSADPAALLGMASAGWIYRAARAGGLSALVASPTARTWLSPTVRNVAAALFGFAFEVPTFALTTRAANEAFGKSQDWSAPALTRDLASGAMVLGGLKLGGAGSAWLERRALGALPSAWSLPSTPFQQGGMLAGIYLGHGVEELSGWRQSPAGATTLTDSLITLLQFNLAGRLLPHSLNKDLQRWEASVAMQNAKLGGRGTLFPPLTPLTPAIETGSMEASSSTTPGKWPSHLILSSSHENDGRGKAPPPSFPGYDSERSNSSRPPPVEHGVILRDALAWGSRQHRSSEDVTRMANFVEKIRVQMWDALNLYVDKPLSRALGQSKILYVRIKPGDGSIDDIHIELSATPTGREVHPDYVELTLDANQGRLTLHDLPSQAAMVHQMNLRGVDQSRSFLGYYRSLQAFETQALQSAHLVAAMPANVRSLVLQQETQFVRAMPASPPQVVPKIVRQPEAALTTTNLISYFPYIAEMARKEVDIYAEQAGIEGRNRQRLHGLVQKLLVGMRAREESQPKVSKYAFLNARMRPDPETPNKRIFELYLPNEAMKNPLRDDEVLFNLVRRPSSIGEDFAHLQHIYINADANGFPTREADRRFQNNLGIAFNLKIRLDSLSTESFNLAEAQEFMKANESEGE